MKIIGLDIGGANTDCSIIEINDDNSVKMKNDREYFPMWKDSENLHNALKKLSADDEDIDVVCVSMTAELADGYTSKMEGVLDISEQVMQAFNGKEVYFVTFDGLKTYDELLKNPLSAAAANWIGTTEIIKYIENDAIFMDMGSTTTDIIPIKNRREIALGHSDLERLSTGELIYTGMLRTNLASIVHRVPIHGKDTRVSSELFSITADIHMILNNIGQEEYTCPTPDGNGKDVTSCKRRLARLVCADLDSLEDEEIIKLAKYIEEKQMEQILDGLKEVVRRTQIKSVLITDVGHGNLCERAARKLGLNVVPLDNFMSKKATNVLTSIGAIQMFLDSLDEKIVLIEKL